MDDRRSPEEFLQEIEQEEKKKDTGRLKIFFGYAAGVGKTYIMLEAAHEAKKRGVDVVAGYIEPHARPETSALIAGLEVLPIKRVPISNIVVNEFDLDAALARHPQLILVDELAHTNAPGCRHKKRYQDIKELLANGIDVYTTVNVQHIESLNDRVATITGIQVRERIPDTVFDESDQVELVDIEPQELLERLRSGKVYKQGQAERAVNNFFTIQHLTALREIALRRCADRVNRLTESTRRGTGASEHILVCLSSAPSNAATIRTAARMAAAFNAVFTALFVETPEFPDMNETDRNRLRENIHLAQQLGASIEAVYGDDVPAQIAEFARISGVTKIVVGRSAAGHHTMLKKQSLTDRLIEEVPNMDIHIIPDNAGKNTAYQRRKQYKRRREKITLVDTCKTVIILLIASLIGFLFECLGFTEANIITIYIIGVLLIAVTTHCMAYSCAASIISVLAFNFFFTEPRFSLLAYDSGYPVTFVIMFLAALITSSLTIRLKGNAAQAAKAAYRTKILFESNQLFQQETERSNILAAMAKQLIKLLNRDIVVYPVTNGMLGTPAQFPAEDHEPDPAYVSMNEKTVANWVLKNNSHAGATTDTLSNAKCLYLAIRVNHVVYGVVGIGMEKEPLDSFENSIVLSILGECALALENEHNAHEKEESALLIRNEQLRSNILRAVSHDLRTPLHSIMGNANMLLTEDNGLDDIKKNQVYSDIYNDAEWLINLVNNLMSVSRLEDGQVKLNYSVESLDDIFMEAFQHLDRASKDYKITFGECDPHLCVKADARLLVQVILNIIDNAIQYTPKGTHIVIHAEDAGSMVRISIADDGPGIRGDVKDHIFEMFYTGDQEIYKSVGIGLALCKSIVKAHGGAIVLQDNVPHGSIFKFTIPKGIKEA